MIITKGRAHAQLVEVGAQRGVAQPGQIARRATIEPHQIAQHSPEARADQIALLGEQPAQIAPGIFQPATVQRYGKAHVGGAGRHAQMVEQGGQVGVGGGVVDDEAGVDRVAADFQCVAVATQPWRSFEQLHLVHPGQQPGRGKPGDAAADHRDLLARARAGRGRE